MICPKCGSTQADGLTTCEGCGVIFAKIPTPDHSQRHDNPSPVHGSAAAGQEVSGCRAWLQTHLLQSTAEESMPTVAGRALVYLLLLVWGARLMTSSIASNYVGESFMHLINLPFHEAGHVLFAPFGRFIQVLGGTLGQWLVPGIVLTAFIVKGNPFGAAVGLWWLGESFLDIAPYMADARAGQLMLLGGVTGSEVEDYHDWEIILSSVGWLPYDQLIARITFACGVVMMLLSLLWGGYLLWRQFQNIRRCAGERQLP